MENFLEGYSKWLDESKKHLSSQAIATYLNFKENLSDKEKQFIEDHLRSCTECRDNFEIISAEDKEMNEIVGYESSVTSETKTAKIFSLQRFIRYSAAAVILIALGLTAYYLFIKRDMVLITQKNNPKTVIDTSQNVIQSDTTETLKIVEPKKTQERKSKKSADEENFAANDVLENFINRNIRSEIKIKILQPGMGDTVNSPITFKWDQGNTTGSNKLIIVDNKNKPIYQEKISGKEITIDKQFSNGLYYWKLEMNGNLEAVGKFYIR